MQILTWEQIGVFVLVLGALIGAYNLILTALKNHREQQNIRNQPINDLTDKVEAQSQMLDRDKRRLEKIEATQDGQAKEIKEIRDGMNLLMRSNIAMIRHFRYNNNSEGLEAAEREITEYLTK